MHQQVTDEVNKAKAAIDDAKKDADVTTAKNNGVEKINNINVPDTSATKEAAKNAIDQAAKTKNDAIDGSNLTDEEKAVCISKLLMKLTKLRLQLMMPRKTLMLLQLRTMVLKRLTTLMFLILLQLKRLLRMPLIKLLRLRTMQSMVQT